MKPLALVTGSSSGIGRAIAVRLASDGFHPIVHFHQNQKGAEETVSVIKDRGGSADLLAFDVRDSAAVDQALDRMFPSDGERPLSVLVNNAGTHHDMLAGLMTDEAFDNVIRTNLYGPFYLLRWTIRRMIRQRSGCIVNVASLSGQVGNPGQINYAASKAALIAMTKTLSMEVGSRGIRVNAVAPGLIETEMLASVPHLDEMKRRIPLGRSGTPDEVAAAVSFLCSKDASYITGHTLNVNGGLYPA